MGISKPIIFISSMRAPNNGATSTDIMTENILRGIKGNGKKVIYLAISEYPEENELIKEHFSVLVDAVFVWSSHYGKHLGKFKRLAKILSGLACKRKYRATLKSLDLNADPELIIAHIPSFESVLYGTLLKKKYPETPYYQYWSDPLTLSGITPDMYSIKRAPFKYAEKKALSMADRVIYGTKTLMDFEKGFFPKYAYKMRYVDVAYVEPSYEANAVEKYSNRIIYSGNYYKEIRNIQPLVDAMAELPDLVLDIYGSGDVKDPPDNVILHGRVSPDEIHEIESHYKISVCLLNHSCIQIPGKIFYGMRSDTEILVIADGKLSESIVSYLNTFDRFSVCTNDSQSILEMLKKLQCAGSVRFENAENYSTQKISGDLLSGGKQK